MTTIEISGAGCPDCESAERMVRDIACPDCSIEVVPMPGRDAEPVGARGGDLP